MGRYDGDYYAVQPPCRIFEQHEWAMNGNCHRCRWTREELLLSALPADQRPETALERMHRKERETANK